MIVFQEREISVSGRAEHQKHKIGPYFAGLANSTSFWPWLDQMGRNTAERIKLSFSLLQAYLRSAQQEVEGVGSTGAFWGITCRMKCNTPHHSASGHARENLITNLPMQLGDIIQNLDSDTTTLYNKFTTNRKFLSSRTVACESNEDRTYMSEIRYIVRWLSWHRAIFLYLVAVANLARLPQLSNGIGSSKTTKQSIDIKIWRFCMPIPVTHGVSVNRTMTEKIFRTNTTPTSASPTI